MASSTQSHKSEKGSNTPTRKRLRKSPLRKTLSKLMELEPRSLENIKSSVEGKEIDKDVLATSKWIVNSLVTLTKAASSDEAEMNGLRLKFEEASREEDEVVEAEQAAPSSRFSLHVLPTNKDV